MYYSKCNVGFFPGIKPGAANSGVTGPTSQIPGLCQTANEISAQVERISGRRVGIFESDSDYVKLAKQGGHKGELSLRFIVSQLNASVGLPAGLFLFIIQSEVFCT